VATWTEDQFYLTEAEHTEKEKSLSQSQRYVVRYLEENGASSLPDIKGAADSCSPGAAKQAVYKLVDMGKVYRTNPKNKGQGAVAVYDLTKEGEEEIESAE
jgi:hypothetical protein